MSVVGVRLGTYISSYNLLSYNYIEIIESIQSYIVGSYLVF